LAQKITVDYDKKVNFARFKTYAWATGTPVPNPPLDLYIVGAIDLNLKHKGLSRVGTEDADLVVTYRAASSTELNVSGRRNSLVDSINDGLRGQASKKGILGRGDL
jgi:hypothetical protein